MEFDDFIREGNDSAALKLLARELYQSGKIGGTRYNLLKRAAAYAATSKEANRAYCEYHANAEDEEIFYLTRDAYAIYARVVGLILDKEREVERELD